MLEDFVKAAWIEDLKNREKPIVEALAEKLEQMVDDEKGDVVLAASVASQLFCGTLLALIVRTGKGRKILEEGLRRFTNDTLNKFELIENDPELKEEWLSAATGQDEDE